MNLARDEIETTIRDALDASGVTYESPSPGQFLVKLAGQHKLATMCWLVVGDHALLVEAFVMRRPDENHRQLYDLLLTRNARMYGVSWAIDAEGDVFLVGRVSLASVSEDEIDRLLGAVLTYADESFDTLLEIGFGTAIRREWAWRHKHGESLANLQAFAHFAGGE
ncbi:MAG TPA: YbjN domain-containing protein [Mycobacteriales bacterium]|nr:YbjN domain-containing protein [Mycobacteriales bacterium]